MNSKLSIINIKQNKADYTSIFINAKDLCLKNFLLRLTLLCIVFISFSCGSTKQLTKNQNLYLGSKIKIITKSNIQSPPRKSQLKPYLSPLPNHKVAGLFPFKLWMYNLVGDSIPSKGFRHWLKNDFGEPPVILKQYQIKTTISELENALNNRGYFYHTIDTVKKIRNQKIKLIYKIETEAPYLLDTLLYPKVTDSLSTYIFKHKNKTSIAKKQYNLQMLKHERTRINDALKKEGFYYFSSSYLFYRLDTNKQKRTMRVYLSVKKDLPEQAKKIYSIGRVYVHHDFAFNDTLQSDTLYKDGIHHLYNHEIKIKPDVLKKYIFLSEEERYNIDNYKATLRKLTNLGVFKFVNIQFSNTNNNSPVLDVHVYLTYTLPKSVRAEFQATSKSNDYVGPGLKLSYSDHNLKQGGELLHFNINSAFETQLSSDANTSNSFDAGANLELQIPRLILPFTKHNGLNNKKLNPETNITAGYNYTDRSKQFTSNAFELTYGYQWKSTQSRTHELDILSVNYTEIFNTYDAFQDNYLAARNLTEQFIFGMKYKYTFNNLMYTNHRINHFFNSSVEFAGHTLSLIDHLFYDKNPAQQESSEILGVIYSQYTRAIGDYRLYYNFTKQNKLVGRVYTGLGMPYGNSNFLPYQKQFYAGGTKSLRAFHTRSVGPGTYTPDSLNTVIDLKQTGDIKLVVNLEYRYNIIKFFKGALFLDAGNVWLLRSDEEIPGGGFTTSSFLSELAVGTGVGLRLDASIFVLCLDVAFPLRKPDQPQNHWQFNSIDLLSPSWRKNNMVFNLAIGYPF